ncbi:MAG: N(2)-fixation sustaining protein CowN [Campylobacteraceae bacterium]
MEEIRDRYVSFANIDCYENAILVLDAMYELFEIYPEAKNELWVRFETFIPKDYKAVFTKKNSKDILYHICSHVFYLSALFETYDFEKGIALMEQAELECC